MNIYLYILVMAVVTYLIRMLPLTLIKEKIENKFLQSFLYYIPYACLMAMTFPAVLFATDYIIAAVLGVAVAIFLALKGKGLVTVAVAASVTVFVASLICNALGLS
ncbi:MAG: AzlD domain-containing protein [Lachnospiraceae bacterium]|nr:AzlD domain-containing protein [Lachnospiraceae bacterium]